MNQNYHCIKKLSCFLFCLFSFLANSNAVTIAGGSEKITISDIAPTTKIEYLGRSTGWNVETICDGNCGTSQTINNLTPGDYKVKIQTFSPSYTYNQYDVVVSSGGGNPDLCAAQGGDTDGDGICDDVDNCRDISNADQRDTDGDGIGDACDDGGPDPCASQGGDSDGDGICDDVDNCRDISNADQRDTDGDGIGDACDDPPTGGGDFTVTGDQEKIIISNISPTTKIEYLGASTGWNVVVQCDGNCGTAQTINNLTPGEYTVKVQTFSPSYTYNQYKVEVTGGGGGPDPCAAQGGDTDGDGICDDVDNCPLVSNANQADADGDGIGDVCDGGGPDPCASQGGDTDGDGICDDVDNCPLVSNANQADTDGDGIGDACDDPPTGGEFAVIGGQEKIVISNIPPTAKIEYLGRATGWNIVVQCDGNCGTAQTINNLTPGDYKVKVQTFSPSYTYNQYDVVVTEGGGANPCATQGGDTDGDGICNDVDNCPLVSNADQADADSDGIGDVCDAPDPCASQGGDTDGDGICDDVDNCPLVSNADQTDTDGDGIGDVCDNSVVRAKNRTIDGTNNNLAHPDWGSFGRLYAREDGLPTEYGDGISSLGGTNRPTARKISNVLSNEKEDIHNRRHLSGTFYAWGQFIDHDFADASAPGGEAASIQLPDDEKVFQQPIPFTRTGAAPGTGTNGIPREQQNLNTSWIDASVVYGDTKENAEWLRTFTDGKLWVSSGNLLPYNTFSREKSGQIDPNAPRMDDDRDLNGNPKKTFAAGDHRAAENPGLTALQTLFVREHNRLCDKLKSEGYSDDEAIYQRARKIVGALIQHFTYTQWMEALGTELSPYSGYKPNVLPDLTNTFATASYRWHTMVENDQIFRDNECRGVGPVELPLKEIFFNIGVIEKNGIGTLLKGFSVHRAYETDLKVNDGLRNFLFGEGRGLDLISINLQRGRDHGLPNYNAVREYYTGSRATSFSDITPDGAVAGKMKALYGNVDNIDLWVGLYAEHHLSNHSVGKTIDAIFRTQFERLRDGDFYFYRNDPELADIRSEILSTTLADVTARNTVAGNFQENIFFRKSCSDKGDDLKHPKCDGTPIYDRWTFLGKIGDKRYYSWNEGNVTHKEGEEIASRIGGNMLRIADNADNDAIRALIPGGNTVWLDIARNIEDKWTFGGVFDLNDAFIPGAEATFFNWNSGEPNNAGGVENAAVMNADGKWNDIPGTDLRPLVAEVRCDDTPQTIFSLPVPIPASFSSDECYTISARHSGKVLEVASSATDNHAIIQQNDWTGGKNQIWRIKKESGDNEQEKTWSITNSNSHKVVQLHRGSLSEGASIHQNKWGDRDNQKWKITKNLDNFHSIKSKVSDKAFTIEGNSTAAGAELVQRTYNGSFNQQFLISLEDCPSNLQSLSSRVAQIYTMYAQQKGDKAVINFVSNIRDADYYMIKRLNKTTQEFEDLALVEDLSSDELETFTSFDENPTDGDNFYKVVAHLKDGRVKETEIQKVNFGILEDLILYPNPAADELNIILRNYKNAASTIYLHDMWGRTVQTIPVEAGNSNLTMDISAVNSGRYFIRVASKGKKDFAKAVVILNEE